MTRLNRGYVVRSIDATAPDPTYPGTIVSNGSAHCRFPGVLGSPPGGTEMKPEGARRVNVQLYTEPST